MHAPDGFYSVGLCVSLDIASLAVIGYCLKKAWKKLDRMTITLAAAIGTLVFAIQLANFSVTRGSSCHCMGGVFSAILLGPYIATIMVSLMHLVQYFVFQDGGLLSLGPNLFTLAIISTFLGYYLYKTFRSLVIEPYGTYIGAFISAWLTLLITAIVVCVMLSISGVDTLAVTLGPMVGPHVIVGIMEGLISMLLLALIHRINPDFFALSSRSTQKRKMHYTKDQIKKMSILFLIFALLLGVLISPFASRKPKGLEKRAIDHGFSETKEVVYYHAPFPDYSIPIIKTAWVGHLISGMIGILITFLLCWTVGVILTTEEKKVQVKTPIEEVISP